MNTVKTWFTSVSAYAKTMLKWLAVAAVVGAAGGLLGSLFHISVEIASDLRAEHPELLWGLPIAGVIIVAIYQLLKTQGVGTNAVIDAVHDGADIPVKLIPAIFLGTVLTHLCGGSAGREGAALQMGGDLGKQVGKLFRLDEKDLRVATMCGMSALFSALFGTPIAAAFFAMEVISIGVFYYAGIVPCIVAALCAYQVSLLFGIAPTRFAVTVPAIDALTVVRVMALAALCAIVSIAFCELLHKTEHLADKTLKNPYLRAFVGGCLLIALTLLVGTRDYNGAGMNVIAQAAEGTARPEAFLLKMLFTAVTIGFGFKGGEVVPTFFVGATFGCTVGALLGMGGSFGAAVGIVSLFCGMVNCPISSLLISVELFGADGFLCYAAACAVSYVLSGYRGLYSHQRILYSKLRAEFINVKAK